MTLETLLELVDFCITLLKIEIEVVDPDDNPQGVLVENTANKKKIQVPATSPAPTAGLITPLSWVGTQVPEYIGEVPMVAANNLNTFKRDAGPQSFDMNIFAEQSFLGTEDIVLWGDNLYNASFSHFWGIGVESDTGINFVDLDFAFFVSGGTIIWFESGVNMGTKDTLTVDEQWWWRLVYDGTTKDLKLYIDGLLVYTAATGYLAEVIVPKHNGRNANHTSSRHIGFMKGAAPVNLLSSAGDSYPFGRATTGFPGHSFVEKAACYTNDKFFIN